MFRRFRRRRIIRPVGQEAKTPPFHGGNRGSIPLRVTKNRAPLSAVLYFCGTYSDGESNGRRRSGTEPQKRLIIVFSPMRSCRERVKAEVLSGGGDLSPMMFAPSLSLRQWAGFFLPFFICEDVSDDLRTCKFACAVNVAVYVSRCAHAGVTEPILYHFHWYTAFEHQRCAVVTQVVEPNSFESEPSEDHREVVRDILRADQICNDS